MQAFCHDHAMLKGNRCILRIRGAPVCQKVPKSYFQSQFSMSKIDGIFSKKNHRIKSIYETLFVQKSFFLGPPSLKFHNRTFLVVAVVQKF